MNYRLYVTDWAPNGTNDLLICDLDGTIVSAVEAATFGIDVTKGRIEGIERQLIADDSSVFPIDDATKEEWEAAEFVPSDFTLVRQISLAELKRYLCVSPIDPQGSQLLAELSKHGIELEGN